MPSNSRWIVMLIIVLALAGCDPATRPAATQPATRDSSSRAAADEPRDLLPGDVVFSRNLQRLGGEYDVLPGQYRLGTAYVRRPPQWWRELAERQKFEAQATTFPLAFVGRWTPEGRAERLVVLQMRHRFNGDGFDTPGPALWLAAYVFEQTPSEKWSLLWSDENALNLHSMQNARFLAGHWEQQPTTIALPTEQKDAQGKMNPTKVNATISRDGKITFSPAGNY
jgi:hypothetical protein